MVHTLLSTCGGQADNLTFAYNLNQFGSNLGCALFVNELLDALDRQLAVLISSVEIAFNDTQGQILAVELNQSLQVGSRALQFLQAQY